MIDSLGASLESVVDEKSSLRGASQEPRARLLHAALDDANLQCENPQATSNKTERICTQRMQAEAADGEVCAYSPTGSFW